MEWDENIIYVNIVWECSKYPNKVHVNRKVQNMNTGVLVMKTDEQYVYCIVVMVRIKTLEFVKLRNLSTIVILEI